MALDTAVVERPGPGASTSWRWFGAGHHLFLGGCCMAACAYVSRTGGERAHSRQCRRRATPTGIAMDAHAHADNPDLKPAERAQQTKEHTLDDMPPLPEDELPGASERSSMAGRLR